MYFKACNPSKEKKMHPAQQCLSGIKVLDLSQYLPGPFAAQVLADLGAEVVKVEPPAGDPMRGFISVDSDGVSPFYKQVNAGKSVVRLDLKTTTDGDLFERLIKKTDVLLESFRPGVLDRLGFDRKRLVAANPRLIHCALSGFGQSGPYRLRGGHDLTYAALAGGLSATGTKAEPVIVFPPLADHAGAQQAVITILAALVRRGMSGKGGYIDVSLFETALSWQSVGLTVAGRDPKKIERGQGLLTGGAAYYHIYKTADNRFMALAAIEKKFWAAFCQAVDRPDWVERQNEPLPQKTLIADLQLLFSARTFLQWSDVAGQVDCCLEPVLDYREVVDHPQVSERKLVKADDGHKQIAGVLFPAWIDGVPPNRRNPLEEISAIEILNRWKR
jgi:crotonobetainyl-CoA:carnitine CoA-transferase CaiB-like acyl-CoA transferase